MRIPPGKEQPLALSQEVLAHESPGMTQELLLGWCNAHLWGVVGGYVPVS